MKKLFGGGEFYEGPRWHDGAWWVSDIFGAKVWRITPDGQGEVMAEVEPWPSGLGWLPDGDLLIVAIRDRKLLRRDSAGQLSIHADLAAYSPFWLNDMLVDGKGRAWVGNLGADLPNGGQPGLTTLCRIDPDGSGEVVASELMFPNGMAMTRDGKTLIVGESLGNRMTAFAVNDDGSLGDRRIWAQFGPTPALSELTMELMHHLDLAPDGCTIDAEDCIWVADPANRRACRVAEGGRILQQIPAPESSRIIACAIGGADGHELLLCVAPSTNPADVIGKGIASLYVERVEVPAP